MTNATQFDPKKRFCIAKGPEGCPACIGSIYSVREMDSFATIPPELEEQLGPVVETVLGMCLITNGQIVIGGQCGVSDEKFDAFAAS